MCEDRPTCPPIPRQNVSQSFTSGDVRDGNGIVGKLRPRSRWRFDPSHRLVLNDSRWLGIPPLVSFIRNIRSFPPRQYSRQCPCSSFPIILRRFLQQLLRLTRFRIPHSREELVSMCLREKVEKRVRVQRI